MRRLSSSYGAGLLFGVGLVISGMTDPRNIVGFLDVAGHWKPNLAAVMVGAVAVHATLLRLIGRRRVAPVAPVASAAARRGAIPPRPPGIDASLWLGSAIFGIGWGISGYCPGPAIVSLGFGPGRPWLFVLALIAGALLGERVVSRRRDPSRAMREEH
jgi:uncharacterized membrane protein YedE/YeeE